MNDQKVNLKTANQCLQKVFAPYVQSLNVVVENIDAKGATLRMPYSEDLCRSGGIICGQALMALIDTCMVFVCYGALDGYLDVTTVTQNTQFMRPAVGRDVIATGTVLKTGRTLIFGEVILRLDNSDQPVCLGNLTYAVLSR